MRSATGTRVRRERLGAVIANLLGDPAALWGLLKTGWHVIEAGGAYAGGEGEKVDLWYTVAHTLRLAVYATAIAAVIGLPFGCMLGLGRFRGVVSCSRSATR